MKKLIRFESKRRPLLNSFAILVFCSMLLALIPAWMLWHSAESQRQVISHTEFANFSTTRGEQLREFIKIRVNTLNVLAATVPELGVLDAAQFKSLFEPLMLQLDAKSLCWHDLVRGDEFHLPEQGSDCDRFDLFQSAQLLTNGDPRILLSQPAGDRSTARAGYISLIIDLSNVSTPTQYNHEDIREFFYFDFSDRQLLKHYQYQGSTLMEVRVQQQTEFTEREVSTILSIPGLSIIYEAIDLNRPGSRPLLIGGIAWLASVLVLLTLAVLRWENSVLDQEVSERTEELTQFGYRASHDLKSPLVSIKQLSAFVLEDIRAGKTDSSIADLLRIERQATELEELVGEILDLSRADADTNSFDSLDFVEIMNSIGERHAALISQRGATLHVDIGAQLPTSGKNIRVVQILDNLISNAVKYIPPDREQPLVEVSLSVKGAKLMISVVDNGIGLGDAFYNTTIVTMFKRYHPQLASGSGIGLTIVCKHVEKLQGTIMFEQMRLGSKVMVELPINNKGLSYAQL